MKHISLLLVAIIAIGVSLSSCQKAFTIDDDLSSPTDSTDITHTNLFRALPI